MTSAGNSWNSVKHGIHLFIDTCNTKSNVDNYIHDLERDLIADGTVLYPENNTFYQDRVGQASHSSLKNKYISRSLCVKAFHVSLK